LGRKYIRARKYIYLCLTSLIFFSFFGCATIEGMKKRRVARQGLLRGQELLTGGAYKESLRENQEVYYMVGESAPGDEAVFTMGLIYAHYKNPEKDYNKAISYFKKLIEDYPQSTLVEQAKLWVGTLEIIEKEKQVDIEIEKKKKELEQQVVEREDPDGPSPVDDEEKDEDDPLPVVKPPHVTVLEDEGGSLYFLALNHYKRANETFYDFILQANHRIKDVRQIDDHQEIIVPVITPESYVKKIPGGDYRVYIGTFTTEAIANGYAQRADSAGKLLSIDAHEFSSQDTWYRLTMGDFKDKEDALKMVILLVKKGLIYIPPERDVMEQ